MIDSYPATDAIRETTDWAQLAAFLTARANADKSFMEEWGDGDECLLTGYGESYRDRMRNASWKALNIPDRQGMWEPPPSKRWRQINDDMRGSFPPTATFASEIAAAIEYYMGEKTEWVERQRERDARRASQAGRQQGGGMFRRWFGSDSSPPDPAPPPQPVPDDVEDYRIVRQEAVAWLRRTRALAPGDALDNSVREQFLAWLDDLHDRNWMRIDGHKPQMVDGVGYVFDHAMFNLAKLSASREDIRAHFPEELYQTYLTAGYEGGAWHQMLGWFHGSQEPKPIDDTMVPLLMLSYDACPDFRICDVGEMQFFIREGDLRAKDFSSVEVQMQGG